MSDGTGDDSGDDGEPDPQERYFRPRLGAPGGTGGTGGTGGSEGSGGPGGAATGPDGSGSGGGADSGSGPGSGDEESRPEGVAVGDTESTHVKVEPQRHRTYRRGARRHRRGVVATGAMSAFVLLFSGGGWVFQDYVLGSVKRINAFEGLKNRPDEGPEGSMNILLTGVDRREGLTAGQIAQLHLGKVGGQRSDTMMLVHISSKHDKITVVSLPRDSLVMIPGHRSNGSEGAEGTDVGERQGKLNWAYMYGGPPLTIQTVERTTGVHVDHYIEINFLGFLKVVNALGGVTVCTTQAIDDPKSGLRLPAGKTNVDGPTALAYSRARYTLTGGSDLGRIDRQQQFMSAVVHKALSEPAKFPAFLSASLDAIRADQSLSKKTLSALAMQMKGMSTDGIAFTTVPLSNPDYLTTIGGQRQSTVQWDQPASDRLFQEIEDDKPITSPAAKPAAHPAASASPKNGLTVPPSQIDVRVVNGVGTAGLAAKAAHDLKKAGFGTTVIPGARHGTTTTVIQYGPGREDSAKTLKAAIPGAKLKEVSSLGSHLQVVVGTPWKGAKTVNVTAAPSASPSRSGTQITARTATQNLCK
jgi:LCP family protein required for cell wall assembly